MSVVRSVSTSELSSSSIIGETMTQIGLNQDSSKESSINGSGNEVGCKNDILTSKAQTLDRFSRPSSMNPHGEKRKKSFFASFRLSKKSFGKGKDEQGSSGSDLSQTPEKQENNFTNQEIKNNNEDSNLKRKEETLCNGQLKPRKHYLNRMSSFVNKVAIRVQGTEINTGYGLRNKLERSQTVTGTDLLSAKVDYVNFDKNQIPGLMGIRNHGNTCFINAVIQCLSHTDVLAEYFVLDQYKNDLARCNRINSKKYGTRGEITEHLAVLLKSLWVLRYVPDISLNLKNIVEKYEPCYRGSNQHDAAEFLMFILDKVHEDLNTASKRKYKKVKNSYGRPDEIVAAETLANHLRCNSSFIQDIFQAQFRSSLKCPHCLKESNTFDPYLCVSIPIPQKEVLSIFVTVVYLNQQPKQVKIGVTIEASSTIKHLRSIIATDCGICTDQLVLTEIDGEGFHRTFSDNVCVNLIQSTDPIYAVELTSPESTASENNGFLHVMWMNVVVVEPVNIRFGGVFQSQIARDITYPDLQKLLLKEMSTIVSMDTLISEQHNGLFWIGIDNGTKNIALLEPDLDLPLLHQSVDDTLSICHPLGGPPHVKLVLQWSEENKEKYITDDVDHIDEHSSVEELKKKPPECAPVTLSDCLQLHTSAEMLSCGDAWHCPTCNRKQQVLKKLNLWSAPQVLVIHLKRFKQVSLSRNSSKLNTIVNFPLNGFDISDHMAGRHFSSSNNNTATSNALETAATNKVLGGVWSPWKRHKKFNISGSEHVYDLYAICNHHGRDLQGGHYTAVCRNPTNGKWYTFDDFNIEEIPQDKVIGQDAYILFYQRREEPLSPCFTYDSESNHWSYKIPLTVLPSPLKIIPSSEDKKAIEDSKQSDNNSNSDETENETTKQQTNNNTSSNKIGSSPSELITSPTAEQDKSVKDCHSEKVTLHVVDTIQTLEEEREKSIQNIMADIHVQKSDLSSNLDDHVRSSIKDKMNTNNISNIQPSTDSSLESDNSDDIPEVRIQPASLEVLASHRYRSCSANQSVIKVTLRPKSHDNNSRPSSIESNASLPKEPEVKLTNGYCSENGSSCDEETPQVRITNSCQSIKHAPQNFKVNNHRMSNANKTPSYVVIRTPTPSPRSTRERSVTCNGTNGTAEGPKCNGGTWRAKTRETYPGTVKSAISKDKRPVSYTSGMQNGKSPTSNIRKLPKEKHQDQRSNGPYVKTKSISCVMECNKNKETRENFMTESSV